MCEGRTETAALVRRGPLRQSCFAGAGWCWEPWLLSWASGWGFGRMCLCLERWEAPAYGVKDNFNCSFAYANLQLGLGFQLPFALGSDFRCPLTSPGHHQTSHEIHCKSLPSVLSAFSLISLSLPFRGGLGRSSPPGFSLGGRKFLGSLTFHLLRIQVQTFPLSVILCSSHTTGVVVKLRNLWGVQGNQGHNLQPKTK